ncbi:hypothetical protein FQR65_LT12136 [Abscondita terminalis]|nr:hypothetical protein FQR65_LT12136 [Abscondita terminalis]
MTCGVHNEDLVPQAHEGTAPVEVPNDHFHFVVSQECESNDFYQVYEDEEYYVQKDGILHFSSETIPVHEYCLDTFVEDDGTKYVSALICFTGEIEEKTLYAYEFFGLFLSDDIPCDLNFGINITDGIRGNKKSINFNGTWFYPGDYEERDGIIIGCVCRIKPCLRKCCPSGTFFQNRKCVPTNKLLVIPENKGFSIDSYHIVYGEKCGKDKSRLMQKSFELDRNGNLKISGPKRDKIYDLTNYCVEYIEDDTEIQALSCSRTINKFWLTASVLRIMMGSSRYVEMLTLFLILLVPSSSGDSYEFSTSIFNNTALTTCDEKTCVRKCCNLNYVPVHKKCVWNDTSALKDFLTNNSLKDYEFFPGIAACPSDRFYLLNTLVHHDDAFVLEKSGRLRLKVSGDLFQYDEFCLDYFQNVGVSALTCVPEKTLTMKISKALRLTVLGMMMRKFYECLGTLFV